MPLPAAILDVVYPLDLNGTDDSDSSSPPPGASFLVSSVVESDVQPLFSFHWIMRQVVNSCLEALGAEQSCGGSLCRWKAFLVMGQESLSLL